MAAAMAVGSHRSGDSRGDGRCGTCRGQRGPSHEQPHSSREWGATLAEEHVVGAVLRSVAVCLPEVATPRRLCRRTKAVVVPSRGGRCVARGTGGLGGSVTHPATVPWKVAAAVTGLLAMVIASVAAAMWRQPWKRGQGGSDSGCGGTPRASLTALAMVPSVRGGSHP